MDQRKYSHLKSSSSTTGKVNFVALLTKLHEINYDSYVTIEREIWNEQQQPDIIHARDYLTQIINEVYGGETLC